MAELPTHEFSRETHRELRRLLGARLETALPSLQFIAGFYQSTRVFFEVSPETRKEIRKLQAVLKNVETVIGRIRRDTKQLLRHATDWSTSGATNTATSAYYTLLRAAQTCERARLAIGDVSLPPSHRAGTFLAAGVAGALSSAKIPLSKGRDGLLAKVLTVVWYDLISRKIKRRYLCRVVSFRNSSCRLDALERFD
jgi:hypothetical protein